MAKKGCNPHVLVIPNSAQGHITPMLQFAKRLVPKGIKISLVTTVYISKSMHVDPESSIAMETISDGFDETGHQATVSISTYFSSFKTHGSRTLVKLIEKFDDIGQPVTGIVYDGLLPWVLDVAKQFGLWKAAFFSQSCAVISIWHHAYRGLIPLPITDPHILVPELPLLKRLETPYFVQGFGQGYATPPDLYDLFNNQFTNIHEADWILFATFYKLEEKVLDRMAKMWKVRAVGPTLPSMYLDKRLEGDKDYGVKLFEPKTSTCMSWLKEKPKGSVVYVALGSVADPTPEQIEELAWGLKGSNRYFLWVVRESVQSKLPNNFVEETSEQGLVVSWCPQLEVLAHESIGCFVTHCGLNSLLEALSLGVPMVGMPQFVDQLTSGKYVEEVWKVGIRALPDEKGLVGSEVLHKSITEIMEGEKGKEAKINVQKWMELAKEAIAEGGSSDKSINEVVASLLCS